eukprot:CAMPEP_0113468686 /NCGR_PEP_ID=MMETSP0014_2-20120614/15490_1 /TAXON_ID=2857 /ORGANISM="Nitzschia sp." /LENGTH=449 /DNA_ID=CAMNT_0000361097 /DNA_START=621 /DNA_END=1970 /DNA_ORIENTATION=- /assembly_acc=CAM_ASM_000159
MPPLSIESNDGSTAAVAVRRQQQEEYHYHQPAQSTPPLSPASQQKNVLPVSTSSACATPASSWESYRRQATTCHYSSNSNSSSSVRRSSDGSITSKGTTVLPKISEKQVRWVDCDDHDDGDGYCIEETEEDTSSSSWTLEDFGNDDNDHSDSTAVTSSSSTAIDSTSNHSSRSSNSNSISTVRVQELARHYIIPHHEELTLEERSNTYYSSTELKAIHREATSSVRQYQHRQHARRWHYRSSSSSSSFSSSRSNSNISTNSNSPLGSIRKRLTAITGEDDDEETLLRGLESYTAEGYQRIYNNRRIAQGVVLNEQYKFRYQQYQRRRLQDHSHGDVDLDDDESLLLHLSNHLAYVSHYNTVTCQDDAIERAQDDAIEAQKVLFQMKGLTSSEQQLEDETYQTSSSTVDGDENNTPSSLGCWQLNPLSELLAVVFQPKKDAFVEILKNDD